MTNSLAEELSAIPDEILIEKIITDVMKWKLICKRCKGTGRIPYIHGDTFKICEDCNGREKEYSESWNPLINWNNTMQVVTKMNEKYRIRMNFWTSNTATIQIYKGLNKVVDESRNIDGGFKRSICIASLIAVFQEKNKGSSSQIYI